MSWYGDAWNSVKRVGHKAVGAVKRVGTKVAHAVDEGLRIGVKVAGKVGSVAGQIAKYGKYAIPIATFINPAFGGAIASGVAVAEGVSRVAGAISAAGLPIGVIRGAISAAGQSGQSIMRGGRAILQDPSTSVANMRQISKDYNAGRKSVKDAYSEGKALGVRIQRP